MNIRSFTIRALMDGKELAVSVTLRDRYTQLPIPQVVIQHEGRSFSPSSVQVDYSR